MKKKTILITICLAVYCYLFYDQYPGINLFIFNVFMISSVLILDSSLLKRKNWVAVAIGALLTSIGALLYGNALSCMGNFISLLLLANVSLEKESSLIYSFVQSVFSFFSTPFIKLIGLVKLLMNPDDESEEETKSSIFTVGNVLKISIPLVILLIFFLIYKNSNIVFSNFIDNFHIKISWDFIVFTVFGLILIYLFFNQHSFSFLTRSDKTKSNLINGLNGSERSLFRSADTEFSSSILTFALLNGLLFLVNVLDLKFIFFDEKNVQDYSKYIHQGVNSSIFSVIIAILVVLYFFRGNLNFYSKNKSLRILALMWIAQNIILLIACFHKNYGYIYEFGLTHKRIGVYVYLLITFIGLVFTWIKIMQLKSNMYLVRTNTWSIFTILVFSTLINWNKIVFNHNTTYKPFIEREYYFDNLPKTSLPFLLKNWKELPVGRHSHQSDELFEEMLLERKETFVSWYGQKQWQSWNLEDQQIYREIQNLK